MDWNKTKTLFILIFLVLDVFLFYQYYMKVTSSEYELLAESSFEDRMKENEITYPTLPKQTSEEAYLSAKSHDFTKEEISSLKNQKSVEVIDQTMLTGRFTKMYIPGEEFDVESLNTFVRENILYGDEYKFWDNIEEEGRLVYYQMVKERVIYESKYSKLELFYNQNGEIMYYEQTFLDNVEPFNEVGEIKSAIKTLEILYTNGFLPAKSQITNVELGYTNPGLLSASHVLTPTWRIVLNNENVYVDAVKGDIIPMEDRLAEEEDMEGTEEIEEDTTEETIKE